MNFKTMRRGAMLLACFLTAGLLRAQIPNLINYQGKITFSGAPGSGSFSITFTIYPSATSATVLFTETQTVPVTNGVFNVLLGDKTTGGIPSSVFTGSGDRYLGVKVGVDPEISPRFRLTSVAFAIRATEADGVADGAVGPADLADNAVTAQKIAANNVVKSINSLRDNVNLLAGSNVTITPSGNTLTIAASGVPPGVTAVNAGAGLTNSGTSSNVTLDIGTGTGITVSADAIALNTTFTDGRYVEEGQPSSVNSNMIVDGAVGPLDLADNAVDAAKIAANNVVKSINSLKDNVTLAPGANVTITPSGNTLTIAAASGPLAYAFINWSGAVLRGTPNVSCTYNATSKYYEITIAGEAYVFSNYATLVTPVEVTGGPFFAETSSFSGKLLVTFFDKTGARVQLPTPGGFQFVTYKLP